MSDSEVPRRSASAEEPVELKLPQEMQACWDDPPSSLSEQELMRMTPDQDGDHLLAAISDVLWEPIELDEAAGATLERLNCIMTKGETLRARWAETAALEETFAVPSPTLQERQRSARQHRKQLLQERVRRQKRRRILVAATSASSGLLMLALMAYAIAVMTLDGSISPWPAVMVSGLAVANTTLMLRLSRSMVRTSVRSSKPPRRMHHRHSTAEPSEEATMITPD
ncbi:hypothetical protein [Streptomyces hilarionis]|uniref:hypothetical protein n=1 Tax=Streptomyces hilarionis TaxID=2839954 RepID=UPI002119FACB|nr:hypothetical protein [Streptomyces hilarionis]MCQ9132408.1 hypothetical protein [Streptomyces hilarionis]